MKKIVLVSIAASSVLMAGGYKIPETSTNSVALGGANIAHTKSADAAYDNPANMIFMSEKHHMEVDLMYVGISSTNYEGSYTDQTGTTTGHNISSENETFLIPSLHYVSPTIGNAKVGLSIVVPGGLTRRWKEDPAKKSAEEFTLRIVEVNPTAAFKVNEKLALGVGFRIVHSEGVVKATPSSNALVPISQDMSGDSLDFGYNLALAYKPNADIEIGLTYRSQVNLTEEGSANLVYTQFTPPATITPVMNGTYDASITVPLPATFAAAIAYTLPSDTTVELVYEHARWSAYENINFDYTNPTAEAVFGTSRSKNWNDTNTFRLGLTQELDSATLMAGLVIDETPVPEETLGFETPGSDSISVSLGARYDVNEKMDVAFGALYSMKEDRVVKNNSIDGKFTDSNVILISAGVGYKF
ncbi:aromatic hydrocarbon degradation protein [Sulfurimonas aquatica]|uniref:Aromatic hydrocarbon degradation protein n=1 Tax=Sulfurimonas aquatica TaxID=2672570 RepID=A0A975AYH5_9BACT|nr:outer membrane protein transport protein [Sulfurimonas aquatica]QSZ40936.1 aromatic hydrocarbon degradation protein [Sulfurimonas aquatica]